MVSIPLEKVIYAPSMLEVVSLGGFDAAPEIPGNGFHTLYEQKVCACYEGPGYTSYSYYLISYIEGGNRSGLRYTIVTSLGGDVEENLKGGWIDGFQLPVPARPMSFLNSKDFVDAIRGLKPRPLLSIEDVPGFCDENGNHRDGWYTRSILVRELVPDYASGFDREFFYPWGFKRDLPENERPRFFCLREGVYIYFPDDSYRLVSNYEFYNTCTEEAPDYRQGDLLIWLGNPRTSIYYPNDNDRLDLIPEGGVLTDCCRVDRHNITRADGGQLRYYDSHRFVVIAPEQAIRITHPEHDPLELPAVDGYYNILLAPGTSRPFSQEESRD